MLNGPTPSAQLDDLATMVCRLRPDWRDAEAFYETRSEIAGALLRLSRRLAGRSMAAADADTAAASGRCIGARQPTRPATPALPAAPRRMVSRRHRYPRPPALPVDVQPRMP
jgi:hypothetical protein